MYKLVIMRFRAELHSNVYNGYRHGADSQSLISTFRSSTRSVFVVGYQVALFSL